MNTNLSHPKEPHIIGEAFENYVRSALFLLGDYELLERSPAYAASTEQFALNALKPDFKFRDKRTKREFYVEVKFRRRYYKNNEIQWTYKEQLERYQSYDRACPTFLLIGTGESYECLSLIGLIPIKKAQYTRLFIKTIKSFEIPVGQAVSPEILWSL